MQSKAANVDLYLKEVPAERLITLIKLRELYLKQLKGYKEVMEYGGPCYKKSNIVEAGFASQKHFTGLYILKQGVMEKYKDKLKGKGISIGKGVITKPGEINFDIVNKILQETFTSTNRVC
ncbi:MAG: DUF1801 domain-containing protein [Bacteroidota bacterium]